MLERLSQEELQNRLNQKDRELAHTNAKFNKIVTHRNKLLQEFDLIARILYNNQGQRQ